MVSVRVCHHGCMALGGKPVSGGVMATLRESPRRSAVGVVLFLASLGFVYWNETRAVSRYTALDQSADIVISVAPDRVDPSHEGQLVHVRGGAQNGAELVDEVFGVKAPALRLVRHVETYAWEEQKRDEKRKNDKGEEETVTTYTYTKRFFAIPPDSSKFKESESHKNPEKAAFPEQEFLAKDTRLGAFVLPSEALSKLTKFEPVKVTQDMLARSPHASQLRELEGAAFYGKDPKEPQVGDSKISYQMVRPQPVSVVAKQSGGTFVAYEPDPSQSVFLVEAGEVESRAMFAVAKDDTSNVALGLRGLGTLLGTIGLALLLVPFGVRRAFVPGFRKLPRVSAVVFGAALASAAVASTMGAAWVAVRPALGAPLFVLSVACLALAIAAERKSR